ncbi:MAG: hypothetical protein DHS20C20_31670 [Ardenticatenaceae bacterium]|nr:MAG: hypothetical protein DHS20C20_31670 [Ardenticatenaceae bacterium]
MKITRDVIVDLLPIYLANEASDDTRFLIEQYLSDDPALAKLVEQSNYQQWEDDIPAALNREHEMKSFEKAKQLLFQQKLFLALAVGTTLLFIAFRFDSEGAEWLWANSPQVGGAIFLAAGLFWTAFWNVNWQISRNV